MQGIFNLWKGVVLDDWLCGQFDKIKNSKYSGKYRMFYKDDFLVVWNYKGKY